MPKAYIESQDLVENLKPLLCKDEIRILTDNPSFEYKKLNIDSRNIHQTFGAFKKDMYVLEEFLKKSNSKNIKYFYNPNVIILRKDNNWFSTSNGKDKDYKESKENIKELESLGFKLKESKYFYIYAKGC